MSAELTCLLVIAAWLCGLQLFVSHMTRKEVDDTLQLRASREAHPAGRLLKRQTGSN